MNHLLGSIIKTKKVIFNYCQINIHEYEETLYELQGTEIKELCFMNPDFVSDDKTVERKQIALEVIQMLFLLKEIVITLKKVYFNYWYIFPELKTAWESYPSDLTSNKSFIKFVD